MTRGIRSRDRKHNRQAVVGSTDRQVPLRNQRRLLSDHHWPLRSFRLMRFWLRPEQGDAA